MKRQVGLMSSSHVVFLLLSSLTIASIVQRDTSQKFIYHLVIWPFAYRIKCCRESRYIGKTCDQYM